MLRLDGKTAVVTGGGSGIGKGISEMFAQQGAHVAILEIDQAVADQTVSEIQDAGGQASVHICDISNQNAVGEQVDRIVATHQHINLLVNNAGIAHIGSVTTTAEEDFDRVMAVNVKGVYNCCHKIIPHMPSGSAIVNIASTVAWFGLAERFAYSTSKGAVAALTYSVARDYVDKGIRCNAILPGRIHTPFVDGFVAKNYPGQEEEIMKKLSEYQPIGRMGRPEEIAVAALFLCSDEASFVTGSIHPIDGGTLSLR